MVSHECSRSLVALGLVGGAVFAQQREDAGIVQKMRSLRGLPDDQRAVETKNLAFEIRALADPKLRLSDSYGLANLSTEGDFGRATLQAVTDTLAQAVVADTADAKDFEYDELAQLSRFENMKVSLTSQGYRDAQERLNQTETARAKATFTLTDITGKNWNLSDLKGKVVLVNFWATWCPPCRKEMPDLEALQQQFKDKGLVVLAISDEKQEVVSPFVASHGFTFPILLDPERKVNEMYQVQGIPKSLIYDRRGRLVAESIDMRTRNQFLGLLAKAGLR